MTDLVTCLTCIAAHLADLRGCPNPACTENPDMSEERKRELRERHAKYMAEQLERENLARIRARAMAPKGGVGT